MWTRKSAPRRVNDRGHGTEGMTSMQDAPYREIPLYARDGSIVAFTKVSPGDYGWLSHFRWKMTPKGYAQRETSADGRWVSVRMHRSIMGLERGDEAQVDHINRDKLDNRRENLRIVTAAQQARNVPGRNGVSGVRNVYPSGDRWIAKVRRRHLGTFNTMPEAIAAAKVGRLLLMPECTE